MNSGGAHVCSGRKKRAVSSHDDDKAIGPSIAHVRKQQKIPVKPAADKDGECFCAAMFKGVARHG